MKRFVICLLLSVPGFAQDPAGYERILLPVYAPGQVSGAGSSSFATVFQIYAPEGGSFHPDPFGSGALRPGVNYPYLGSASTGRVLLVSGSGLAFDLKALSARDLKALSPNGRDFTYSRMPVVRETELLAGPARILGIPFSYFNQPDISLGLCCESREQFRHMLRIYDVDARGGAEVTVRVRHPLAPNGVLFERRVALSDRDGSDAGHAYYTRVPIENPCFPRPGSFRTGCASAFGMIEIEPTDPALRYWAFVTSTHNLTHDIAVSVP
jgi:hypothetical protein